MSQAAPVARPRARPADELLQRAAALAAAGARVRARLDEDAVHDLRVAARRLEVACVLWGEACAGRAARGARSAREAARQLRQGAAEAREAEVHAALLESLARARGVHAAGLAPMRARLRAERDAARAALATFVRPTRFDRVADEASVLASALPADAAGKVRERRLARALERFRVRAASALERAAREGGDVRLHAARVAIKKWRYAAESRADAPRGGGAPLRELKALQRRLGAVHDHAMLRAKLASVRRRSSRPPAPRLEAALATMLLVLERRHASLRKPLPARLRALAAAAR